MRLNIFLLHFFVAVFIFETAAEQCENAYGAPGKLVEPTDSSRFFYGKYVMVRKDPITIWLRIPNPNAPDFTIYFKVLSCLTKEKARGGYGTLESLYIYYRACGCELNELFGDKEGSYMPLKLWTDNIVYEMYFLQDRGTMEMYIDEEEAEKRNSLPQQPPHESSMKISSKNGTELPSAVAQTKEFNCDDDGFPLWLLILVIIIDIILAIILILLIIFVHRGIKKMKKVITKKKKPKAAASKHGAPSPMPTTPTPNAKAAATKDKKKTTEKSTNREPKAAGKTNGKTTEGKTTNQTKYYTVDSTFDKTKDEKK